MDSSLIHEIIGAGGTAALTLVLILLGILVPKAYHDKALEQIDKLQAANDNLTEALAVEREQNTKLSSSGNLTNMVVRSLIEIAHERNPQRVLPGGDHGVAP